VTRAFLLAAISYAWMAVTLPAAEAVDTARRTEELKSLHWGMFICWSFSTFSGKEWTPGVKDIAAFQATAVDTDQWARVAKEAEMGYILFLTKHHDGFCLWDTKTTSRKVTRSPLGRDVLAELRRSCDKYGIKLALYFSEGEFKDHRDYHPGGYTPEMKKAQLQELLTNYGPIEYIWFDHAQTDGGLSHKETFAWCKQFQPGCFLGFNHCDQADADIRLGEMGRPGALDDHRAAGPHMRDPAGRNYRLAEFTYPILPPHHGGAMWFYSLPIHDRLCHSPDKLYADYVGAVQYGNIFSLDVGPDYAGLLRAIDVETLRQVGAMIRARAPKPAISPEPQTAEAAISAVVPDLDHLQKWDDMQGDTADPFWADDGNLYHFTCDGRGFGSKQRNFCFNKLAGPDLLHLTGAIVNSMDEYGKANDTGPDGATWKVCGQECIDGAFYAFVARNIYGDKSKDPLMRQTSFNASLIRSADRGRTWSRSAGANYDAPMWPGKRFGSPSFIHYGQNGGDTTRDNAREFVYAISNNGFWNGGDDFILGRVRRSDLPRLRTADWTYFSGGDGLAAGAWTADIVRAKPILSRAARLGVTAPVFIPSLGRYLLVSWYVTPTLKKWFEPQRVVYDFYEAAHPWGPWNFVSAFDDRFLTQGQHMYGPNLCAKYQEPHGAEVTVQLFTSGCPFQDNRIGLYKNWRIPLMLTTRPLPSVTRINDDDPRIRYTGHWQASRKRGYHDYQDDVHYTKTPGDRAEFTFIGTGIQWLAEKFSDQGRVEVFLDGKSCGNVNLKVEDFPRLAQIPVFSAQGLAAARHTIQIVNAGSDYIAIDAFTVFTDPQR
jgi:alpha-L-fucosidase